MEKTRVLIVGNHPLEVSGMRKWLERWKSIKVVGEAANLEQAARRIRRLKPHVVVVDVTLTRLDGQELVATIIDDRPDTKILLIGDHPGRGAISRALSMGAHGFVSKGSSARELCSAIRGVSKGTLYFPEELAREGINHEELFEMLSPRELLMLELVAHGLGNQEIGDHLNIKAKSVADYITALVKRLGVANRAQVLIYAFQQGFVDISEVELPRKADA